MIQDYTDSSVIPESGKYVILFTAEWHEAASSMNDLVMALSSSVSTDITFGRVNADDNPELCQKYNITAVPTFIFLNDTKVVESIVGGDDAAAVTNAVQRLVQQKTDNTGTEKTETDIPLSERLDRLIRTSDVMVFMKGTPNQPRCGFSRQIVEILNDENIPFASFDILTDETVRQGLKKHSNWPTYPQLYVNGELIGGLDIIKEMKQDDSSTSLKEQLGITTSTTTNESTATTNDATESTAPKKYQSLNERLRALTNQSKVMLFMKGLPSQPKCGFSREMVDILNDANVSFDAFDILTDEDVRQGLKIYSDWPTYPQLYVNGDLIGGLDIVKEMITDGTLQDTLES